MTSQAMSVMWAPRATGSAGWDPVVSAVRNLARPRRPPGARHPSERSTIPSSSWAGARGHAGRRASGAIERRQQLRVRRLSEDAVRAFGIADEDRGRSPLTVIQAADPGIGCGILVHLQVTERDAVVDEQGARPDGVLARVTPEDDDIRHGRSG